MPATVDPTHPASTAALRQQLRYLDDVKLDELCMDDFDTVYDKFTRGLRRDEKINLLLEHCWRNPGEAERLTDLLAALRPPRSTGNGGATGRLPRWLDFIRNPWIRLLLLIFSLLTLLPVFSLLMATFIQTDYDCANASGIPHSECEALVALYESTDGDNWTNNTGWLATNAPCDWHGVTCASGNVTEISLGYNQLNGMLPLEISALTALMELWINNNQLSGTIPPQIGDLTMLQYLSLSDNQLSGTIPSEISNLIGLMGLWLNHNRLSGVIPPEISHLTALTGLYLHGNQLSGAIPPEIGALTALQHLSLHSNQLSGALPPEIGALTALQYLYLHSNQLNGTIPSEIASITGLLGLYLHNNQLSGALPGALTAMTQLIYFHFNNTNLCVPPTGTVPKWLDDIPNVQATGLICGDDGDSPAGYEISLPIAPSNLLFWGACILTASIPPVQKCAPQF